MAGRLGNASRRRKGNWTSLTAPHEHGVCPGRRAHLSPAARPWSGGLPSLSLGFFNYKWEYLMRQGS